MQHEYVVLCTTNYYPQKSSMFRSLLTPRSRVLPQMLTTPQIVKKFSTFMQPECSLPYSQAPATCPYSHHSIPVYATSPRFLKFHFHIVVPSTPKSSKWSPSLRFLRQNFVCTSPLSHTCLMPHQSHPNHPNDT